jgi:hypothetical protein
MDIERDETGKFAPGNSGGPGRPRRATERAYLLAFSDALTLEDWRAIVGRAVEDAKSGDAKSREWLSRYALGAEPTTLAQLAALEALGVNDDMLTAGDAEALATEKSLFGWGKEPTGLDITLDKVRERAQLALQAELEEEQRQKREARKAKKLLAGGDNGDATSS